LDFFGDSCFAIEAIVEMTEVLRSFFFSFAILLVSSLEEPKARFGTIAMDSSISLVFQIKNAKY
jgi:hypothetical protein